MLIIYFFHQFAECILEGKATTFDTSTSAVNSMRVDIASTLLRESGVFPFWLIICMIFKCLDIVLFFQQQQKVYTYYEYQITLFYVFLQTLSRTSAIIVDSRTVMTLNG